MTTIVQFENVGLRHATGTEPAPGAQPGPMSVPVSGPVPVPAMVAPDDPDSDTAPEVLADITVSLHAGVFYLLTGPGGAGKTSFLDLLGLVRRPTRGTLHLFGEEVTALPRARLPALRRRIGMVHRDGRLLPHLSVAQNVALPLRVAGLPPDEIDRAVAGMLARIDMADRAHALPATLSAGARQQVAIARAFVARPALVVADEPAGMVDPAAADRLLVLLGTLGDDATTVVMATHDSRLFTRLPRARMLRLDRGRLHDPAARPPAAIPDPAAPVPA